MGIMKHVRWAAIAVLMAIPAWPQDASIQPAPVLYRPLTATERWDLYAKDAFRSPLIAFRVTAGASIAQWRDEPPEWGQGGAGLGRRMAHRFGRLTVQESCEATTAALLRHDVRYFPSRDAGIWARTSHALAANFVTLDRNGDRTVNAARLGGIVAAELVSRQWMPDRYRSAYRTSRGIAIQLGFSTAFNVLREFTPDLKRLVRRNHRSGHRNASVPTPSEPLAPVGSPQTASQ